MTKIFNVRHFIFAVVMLAFLLRIAGILYGLPLMLVNDEGSLVLGALKMIEVKTVIPALHPDLFDSILYYPPYLCYLYHLPFVVILGVKFLFWHGSAALFSAHVLSDLSAFFI